ncbi:dienelactone hydrolase family protein [Jiangella alkaliphila]|uniref:Dienelactone hydrolase n=1 Tax=Jiangella alkaliphila TaxID=419479 RepID=A0A1H2ILK1_9ACTN|nr:dienelactone hydrolase family protein [Jiangella alkaliphila]SDU44953.1 Dienelactone hydrolase [Jiangella alkaliphila]
MTEIVLFHSVLGLRPGVLRTAERWRAAGHVVHVPDLYGGAVFDDYDEAFEFLGKLGGQTELARRTEAAVDGVRPDVVYAGFSNGVISVVQLVTSRPGARGALAFHGSVPVRAVGAELWPSAVPVQVHEAELDPFRENDANREFAETVAASGASYHYFSYPGVAAHLFADPSLTGEYAPDAAELLHGRALEFIAACEDRGR